MYIQTRTPGTRLLRRQCGLWVLQDSVGMPRRVRRRGHVPERRVPVPHRVWRYELREASAASAATSGIGAAPRGGGDAAEAGFPVESTGHPGGSAVFIRFVGGSSFCGSSTAYYVFLSNSGKQHSS